MDRLDQFNKSLIYAYIDHQVESAIDNQLLDFLKLIKMEPLFITLSYVTKELVANAYKANLKRVHFKMLNLNINSIDEYKKGILSFRESIKDLDSNLFRESKSLHTYVKIDFTVENRVIVVSVTNNTPLIEIEKKRILEKINNAKSITSFEEATTKLIDTEEGSGLGLTIAILLLKKIGLSHNIIEICEIDGKTEVKVKIPMAVKNTIEQSIISEEVASVIDELPPFPQHILELQKNLSDPNANFKDLIKIIIKDPPLIAKILKIANSSLYMLPKEVTTIDEAVRIIGFEGIKSIVFAYNIENLLSSNKKGDLKIIQEIIQHSLDVAFYAFKIAKILKYDDAYSQIFMAATLHDIGKIVIHSLNPALVEKLNYLCNSRGVVLDRVEDVASGLNHSFVGAEIAKKWNFPEYIIDIIKNHHTPLLCNEENKALLYIIYLANALFYYKDGKYDINKVNYEPLAFFSITEKGKLEALFNEVIAPKQSKA